MRELSEILRLVHNLIRIGTVAELDHEAARARLADGEMLTDWRPWLAMRAGTTRDWDPPTVGEQALLLCPGGDPAVGIIVTGIFSTAHAAPINDAAKRHRSYPDGAVVEYDHEKHHLQATIPGTANIDATGDVTVNTEGNARVNADQNIAAMAGANITAEAEGTINATAAAAINLTSPANAINGPLQVSGTVTLGASLAVAGAIAAQGDVVGNGKSLSTHTHPGDSGGNTGAPQ